MQTQTNPRPITGTAAAWTGALAAMSLALLLAAPAAAVAAPEPPANPPADWTPTAADYTNVPYPHPVHFLEVNLFGRDLRMAYMDVPPAGQANGRVVVLFHGMNFFAAAYATTIEALCRAGFRVVAIDRLGFGRSSKPVIRYDLHLPAHNTNALLDHLGIERAAIVGHSMGGMVATRFAASYPARTSHLVMVNQIGLTDLRRQRPWQDPEAVYRQVLATGYQDVLAGHRRYYPSGWRDAYLPWVRIQYGLTLSGEWPRLARVRAAQQQILFHDPVVYEWQHVAAKALVVGGAEDRLTDDFPTRARHVAESLQNAELVIYPEVGHAPAYEIPDRFHGDLIRFLRSDPDEPADQSWR